MRTKFGVDNSSRFPLRVLTNRQTDATECPIHAGSYTDGVGNYFVLFQNPIAKHHTKY